MQVIATICTINSNFILRMYDQYGYTCSIYSMQDISFLNNQKDTLDFINDFNHNILYCTFTAHSVIIISVITRTWYCVSRQLFTCWISRTLLRFTCSCERWKYFCLCLPFLYTCIKDPSSRSYSWAFAHNVEFLLAFFG
jgi:hypothetical protein